MDCTSDVGKNIGKKHTLNISEYSCFTVYYEALQCLVHRELQCKKKKKKGEVPCLGSERLKNQATSYP